MRVLLVLVLLGSTACAAPFRSRIEISRDEIQERVARRFPLEQKLMFAKVSILGPSVILNEKSDRIGLSAKVLLEGPGLRERGSVSVDGKLRYDDQKRVFFLEDATVLELDMPHLEPRYRPAVERVSTALITEYLNRVPVYEVKESSAGVRWFLRKVDVKDGRVIAEMGL